VDKRHAQFSEEVFLKALAIIRAGKEMLAKRPRVDMPGFVPCAADRKRDSKYDMRRQIERRNRQAIQAGRRVYDDRPG